jgi:hypothetical protein
MHYFPNLFFIIKIIIINQMALKLLVLQPSIQGVLGYFRGGKAAES